MWKKITSSRWFSLFLWVSDVFLTLLLIAALLATTSNQRSAVEAQKVMLESNKKLFAEAQNVMEHVREQVIRLEGLNNETDKNLASFQTLYTVQQNRVQRESNQLDEILHRIDMMVSAGFASSAAVSPPNALRTPTPKMEEEKPEKRPPLKRARNNVNFTTPATPTPIPTPTPTPKPTPKSTPNFPTMNSGTNLYNSDYTQPFKNGKNR